MSAPTLPTLSRQFDSDSYRARPTDSITWRAVARTARQLCDECRAIQHETRGESGRPNPARHRRSIDGAGVDLMLCVGHADAWHTRDDIDTEPARHRRRLR